MNHVNERPEPVGVVQFGRRRIASSPSGLGVELQLVVAAIPSNGLETPLSPCKHAVFAS
jgi:hypothetical protein